MDVVERGRELPAGAVPFHLEGVNAATQIVLTQAVNPGQRGYLQGFSIDGQGATGTATVLATLSGLLGGDLTRNLRVPAGVTINVPEAKVEFYPPRKSLDLTGTDIVLTVPSFGAGNLYARCSIWGYILPGE